MPLGPTSSRIPSSQTSSQFARPLPPKNQIWTIRASGDPLSSRSLVREISSASGRHCIYPHLVVFAMLLLASPRRRTAASFPPPRLSASPRRLEIINNPDEAQLPLARAFGNERISANARELPKTRDDDFRLYACVCVCV